MKKQLKRNTVKDVYLEEDVYFGDSPTTIEIVEVDKDHDVVQYANDNWDDLLEANNKDHRIEFVKKNGVISLDAELIKTDENSLGTTEKEKLAIREGLKAIADHEKYMKSEKELSGNMMRSEIDNILNEHLYPKPEKPKGFVAKIKSFFKKG